MFFRGTPAPLTHISLTCWRPARTELRFVTKVIEQSSSPVNIARPENWHFSQNFQSPSLRTHASNEFYCVCRKSVKLFWMKSFKCWVIDTQLKRECELLHDSLHLGFKRNLVNEEQRALSHHNHPPCERKKCRGKSLKSNLTRGTEILTKKGKANFKTFGLCLSHSGCRVGAKTFILSSLDHS